MAGRRRDAALDRAIVRAASDEVRERGYAEFAIEAVANRLNIPKSTVYTRWRSRSELLGHALSGRLAAMGEIDLEMTGDLRLTLIEHVAEDIGLSRTREGLAVAQAVLAARDDQGADLIELVETSDRRRAGYRRLLEQGRERGDLPADTDVDLLLDMLLGSVWAAAMRACPRDESEAPRLVDAVLAVLPRRDGG